MSCAVDCCPCTGNEDYNKVEQLAGCNLGYKETKGSDQVGDDSSGDDSSFYFSSSDDDDDDYDYSSILQVEPEKQFLCRSVDEGGSIVKRFMNTYAVTVKGDYKPTDDSKLNFFYEKLLERVVGRFAKEALCGVGGCGDFMALLSDDETQKLSGMDEVAEVELLGYVTLG